MTDAERPGRPAFLNPEVSDAYPGVVEPTPTFDAELDLPEPPPAEDGQLPAVREPYAPHKERWREVARLYATGKMNLTQIAAELGYSRPRLSLIMQEPWVQEQVAKYRQQVDVEFRELARDGLRTIHRMILDPKTKDSVRADLSKWAGEKEYGKARQEVVVEGGNINVFIDVAKDLKTRGEPIDVTPPQAALPGAQAADTPQPDPWDTWLDQQTQGE